MSHIPIFTTNQPSHGMLEPVGGAQGQASPRSGPSVSKFHTGPWPLPEYPTPWDGIIGMAYVPHAWPVWKKMMIQKDLCSKDPRPMVDSFLLNREECHLPTPNNDRGETCRNYQTLAVHTIEGSIPCLHTDLSTELQKRFEQRFRLTTAVRSRPAFIAVEEVPSSPCDL